MGALDGKVAVITGASRGIGAEVAALFAAQGAVVAVTARTSAVGEHQLPGSLAETVEAIASAGGRAIGVPADLAAPGAVDTIVDAVHDQLGSVDILVNNAAVAFFAPIAQQSANKLRTMFNVDVFAPVALTQRLVPDMTAAGAGWICNLSSPGSRHPQGPPYEPMPVTGYGMCKQAIERFTTGLASELYAANVAVNCVWPTQLVVTPVARMWGWDQRVPIEAQEPVGVVCQAILALCSGDPAVLTRRLVSSQELCAELGIGWSR